MMRKKLNLSPLDRQGSFPFYTIAPVAGTILCNMLTYYGSRLITRGLPHWDLTLPLDRWIPFVPSAVSIYVLAFLSWVVGRRRKQARHRSLAICSPAKTS